MKDNVNKKDLKHYSRMDLIELLLEKSKELESMELELKNIQEKLNDREIKINEAGNIAEASLKLNNIFNDAQNSANLYLSSLKTKSGEQLCEIMEQLRETEVENCKKMHIDAQNECNEILENAKVKSEEEAKLIIQNAQKEKDLIINSINEECNMRLQETNSHCDTLKEKAELEYNNLIEKAKKECEEMRKQCKEECKTQVMKLQNEINRRLGC